MRLWILQVAMSLANAARLTHNRCKCGSAAFIQSPRTLLLSSLALFLPLSLSCPNSPNKLTLSPSLATNYVALAGHIDMAYTPARRRHDTQDDTGDDRSITRSPWPTRSRAACPRRRRSDSSGTWCARRRGRTRATRACRSGRARSTKCPWRSTPSSLRTRGPT